MVFSGHVKNEKHYIYTTKSVYGHQIWQKGDLRLGAPIHRVT